jgi:hypothetical protein
MRQLLLAPLSALLAAVYFDPDHLGVQRTLKGSLEKAGLQKLDKALEESGLLPRHAPGNEDKDLKPEIADQDECKPCEKELANASFANCDCKPCETKHFEPCECKPCEKTVQSNPLSLSAVAQGELLSHVAIFAMESVISSKVPENHMDLWAGEVANAYRASMDMLPSAVTDLANSTYVKAADMIPPRAAEAIARFLQEFQTRFPKYQLDNDRPFRTLVLFLSVCVPSCFLSCWYILGVWKFCSFVVRGVFCCSCRAKGENMDADGSQAKSRQA